MQRLEDLICRDETRRAGIRGHETLNGIDYLEVATEPEADNQRLLHLYFIPKETAAGRAKLGEMLNQLADPLRMDRFEIRGGVRVTGVRITQITRVGDRIDVRVDLRGDFSPYTLAIDYVRGAGDDPTVPRLDPAYAQVEFSFKAGCGSQFDCRPLALCPPQPEESPVIDYMAKDYSSFRQALLDRLSTLNPDWRERNPADLGMALLEILAYAGDHLSYYQDAVANEAYLETARQRISVRRHALLIDYRIHDGASAWTFVHFRALSTGHLPAGTRVLSKISEPLGARMPPHPVVIGSADAKAYTDAAVAVFETVTDAHLDPVLNEIQLHDWGRGRCCLPVGSNSVDLVGDLTTRLQSGDFLLFEEVKGPLSGNGADADPSHRQTVRLTSVKAVFDPLFDQVLTRVVWDPADALVFPLCVSSSDDAGTPVDDVSVARGNLVLADHGRSVSEWHPCDPSTPEAKGIRVGRRAYRFQLSQAPLSFRHNALSHGPVRQMKRPGAGGASPQVRLASTAPEAPVWDAVESLLAPRSEDEHSFVAETDNHGRAMIRFGPAGSGMTPPDGSFFEAKYRIGVGSPGNLPAEALAHVVNPGTVVDWPSIEAVRNAEAACGGLDPEPVTAVKLTAPAALRQGLLRAVTEADYASAAGLHPEVSKAVASFRWTGSWHTVFVTIDPVAGKPVSPELADSVKEWVNRFLQTGYDLKIEPPTPVPLEIEIDVCVAESHFRADVQQALLSALSNRNLPGGMQGFFHPDRFSFGQPLYLSQLYAAVTAVEGVRSAEVKVFKRFGKLPNQELENGLIPVNRVEVIRLDNDPNFPENGFIRFHMRSGK